MPRGKTSVLKDPTGQRVLLVPGQKVSKFTAGLDLQIVEIVLIPIAYNNNRSLISTKASNLFLTRWCHSTRANTLQFRRFWPTGSFMSSLMRQAKYRLRQNPAAKRWALVRPILLRLCRVCRHKVWHHRQPVWNPVWFHLLHQTCCRNATSNPRNEFCPQYLSTLCVI